MILSGLPREGIDGQRCIEDHPQHDDPILEEGLHRIRGQSPIPFITITHSLLPITLQVSHFRSTLSFLSLVY